jgi:Zn-dependent M28 family amino/carboxypeptidase
MVALAVLPLLLACSPQDQAATAGGVQAPPFPTDSAFSYLRQQVEFGPRVPGTEGHARQLEWMSGFLRSRADSLVLQAFEHEASDGTHLELTNLLARFNPTANNRILLLTHWDTRPNADMDRDAAKQKQPIPGANDGASGTAVLLALADVLSSHSPPIGVDLLFVDGEDWSAADLTLGAKYFAANLPPGYKPLYGILLDMIGDQSPVFPIEGNSQQEAPEVVNRVWRLAADLGLASVFPTRDGPWITDDHMPLNQAGIRTIDIIDFDFGPGNGYWHTTADDLDHVSARGLGAVGTLLTALIFRGG